MPLSRTHIWAIVVMTVAMLNILEVLPDWTAIAAVLTVPFFVSARCGAVHGDAR